MKYAFTSSGEKELIFEAYDADGDLASDTVYDAITITKAPKISSVKFAKSKATVKQKVTITVKTNTTAAKLTMYKGSKALKTWTTGYTDKGTTRTWKVTYAFTATGEQALTFKATDENKIVSDPVKVTITITAAPKISSVKFAKTVKVKKETTITVKTSTTVTKLIMYDGSKSLKTWTEGYTDKGSTRTWKVKYTFTKSGSKALTFKGKDANGTVSAAKEATVEITK